MLKSEIYLIKWTKGKQKSTAIYVIIKKKRIICAIATNFIV
jgi:hypothetical protein